MLLRWLRHSKVAGVMAQATILFGALDAAGVLSVLPARAAAVVAGVGGVLAWYNKTLRSDGSIETDADRYPPVDTP